MTKIFDDPASFADDALDGFAAAHRRYVARVDGGVVRSTETPAGQVALVIGGGSGPLPGLRRPRRRRTGRGQRLRQHVRLALRGPGLPRGQGRGVRRRCAAQLRQLRRGRAALRPGPGQAERRGHRDPHRAGDRRHCQRPARGDRQTPRHCRGPDGLQGCRGRRRSRAGPGRGGTAGGQGQPPHPLAGRRLRRLHPAGRRGTAVHGARGHDVGGPRHPRRTRDLRTAAADGQRTGSTAGGRTAQGQAGNRGPPRGADPQRPRHGQIRRTVPAVREDRGPVDRRGT